MVSLDDRLLGEKLQNYCSSSEDEDDKDNDSDHGNKQEKSTTKFIPESELKPSSSSSGITENTGPKGVIEDWRRFKQLETEKREEQQKEKVTLIKKLTMTCRSYLDEEEAKKKEQEALEDEFFDAEDEFFKEYRAKLMHEMQQRLLNAPRFGKQIDLNRENFTNTIDNENKNVTIIVHVYEQSAIGCKTMNKCIQILAEQYPFVKFCRIQASEAQLSHNFIKNGCPAILVYRGGELLSSFISITNKLGDDFVASDVESFLQESGYLSSAECVKTNTVRDSQTQENNKSDTDDEND
ncbi:unnamed protein product [Rotaria sp. Silwood2]|nr:unnamed protein product [Rotaria sp. Silwood2]CAF3054189.1 unnamed protein product [Rotaria sp. Silwood2]CAF3175152.1 unnamed protein product [Rotaria sp. Silwood2]CAF3346884.1 unnamed protein product [Rotaria sp. Silwood2]CAF3874024.1 unnamed protein product [Rotaria sp. Silwood2]